MPIFKRRSISSLGAKKKDIPEGVWHNCPECKAIIHELDMKQRFRVCPKCDYHFTMTSGERIEMLVDVYAFLFHELGVDDRPPNENPERQRGALRLSSPSPRRYPAKTGARPTE